MGLEIISSLSGTITPYLLGALLTLSFFALFIALKNWREMKRSPYFFQRLQATKRLQTYLSTSAVLFVLAIGVSTYAWQAPADETVRVAILTNGKQQAPEPAASSVTAVEAAEDAADDGQLDNLSTEAATLSFDSGEIFVSARQELPSELDRLEPTADLDDQTDLGSLSFSTDVTDAYEAVNARDIFPEGDYKLFATFAYEGMADGMVWSWVWRRNGQFVDGGHEKWSYGADGPGYVYFQPEEGFQSGEYTLEVWVNRELLTTAAASMNTAAAAAANN